ncbi:MAG TPA: ribonuclease P protein component [Beijerinckiaceae bacterium]|nr:ribonuclease P protein component [Beijerinckiaceae bacterium]
MRGARAHPIGRLTKRPQFVAAASGRRFHTERVTVQGRLREGDSAADEGLRFGFTITKRVGHATERNRIRRRLRAAAREATLAASPEQAAKPADIVVIGRREALAADFRLLVDDLARALAAVTRPKAARTDAARRSPTHSNGDDSRGPRHA